MEKETQYLERVLADVRLGRTVVELFSLEGSEARRVNRTVARSPSC